MKPRIKDIRVSKGLMQIYVAKEAKISQQQLSDYERGRTFPRIDKAYRLAKVLGVEVGDLYED
ncbi:helix-turn-helix transcriptional regulator [Mesobacillus zeae]|uniref:XRE family transcriptional regulator n=1 Tax=Mesobacillus zeae TaxID=1917180 RepID=A0A398B7F6_9BACI|nr:helix-turn-helix transcriptional regulator [Mesobacillus zeae]RID85895.1 XRE family transcriptional regulator [Mesobacillus zeae]